MGSAERKGLVRLLVLAALAALWVFFAPVQIGGSTLYSSTVGISMEPLFHKGDLAVVRRASSYKVGDIVLYESPILHRPVLHRIIVIQGDHYFFKGDNNDFVDPGYAKIGDLQGKLWFHIPKAGRILGWLGAPTHTALLAGAAMAFLLLGGGAKSSRKRRRRRRTGSRTNLPRSSAPVSSSARRYIHRPRKSAENITGGIALVLALALLADGFGAPLARTVAVSGFRQTGTFSYSAKTSAPSPIYPTGVARSGEPLFLDAFNKVAVGFGYRFQTKFAHQVHGTVTLKMLISSDSSWRRLYTLEATTPFKGDVAAASATLDLQQIKALTSQISIESGTVGSEYTIDIQPTVHIVGKVGDKPIDSTFSPDLPFKLTQALLVLNITAAPEAPGASYAAPSAAATLAAGLNPSQTGTIPGLAPNYLSLARYHLSISAVRGAGLGLLGLAVIAFLSKFFKRSREVWSPEKRIAIRYGCVLVDVVSFTHGSLTTQPRTDVPSFESLATLAQYCERPILRETGGQLPAYAVEDDGRLYIYRPEATPSVSVMPIAEAS